MSSTPSLTLVVPTFNEAARLDDGMARLRDAEQHGAVDLSSTEVLFVDDGSTDDTLAAARRHAGELADARVISHPRNLGKGAAVRTGMLEARGSRVVFADADMAIDPAQLPGLLDALETAPIAVGSRAVHGHVDYGSRLRTEAGRAFNRAVRLIGGVDLDDTQCGFKGFRRGPALLLCQLQTTRGYAFDVELLWLATRLDLGVGVVPVSWLDVPGSSVRVLRDSSRMLLDLVTSRRRSRFVSIADLDESWDGVAPGGSVVVACEDQRLLCAAVSDLGALRGRLGPASHPRLLSLEDLVALRPFTCEPAPTSQVHT
jgi:glycosyltransferase involved in cell wall biosynthesis